MCTVCEKGNFSTLSHTLYTYSSKSFIFFNSGWSKELNETIWDFSLKHAHTFLTILILDCMQCLQIRAFQQRHLKCKFETSYLEGELVPKTCKNLKKNCPPKKFPDWFGH